MQEGSDRLLFVEPMAAREIQNVDAAELVIRRVGDQSFDGGDAVRVRRLAQNCEQCQRFANEPRLRPKSDGAPV
jgi:hypothetical protein